MSPQKYRHVFYKEIHEIIGHLGRKRVTEPCRQRFYWLGYENDITHYIPKKLKDEKTNKQQIVNQIMIKNSCFQFDTWRKSFTEKFIGKRRDRKT